MLYVTRKNAAAQMDNERARMELALCQQQKSDLECKMQALQSTHDKLTADLLNERADTVSYRTALEKEKEIALKDATRLTVLEKEFGATRNELTSALSELAQLQQQKTDIESKLQALQGAHDKLTTDLLNERANAVSYKTAFEKEKEVAHKETSRLSELEKEFASTRNELTSALAELARCKTALEKEQQHRAEEAEKIREMQEKHFAQFRNLAGEIMEQNAGKLKDTNKESMDSLLKPLRVQLESLGQAVKSTNETAAGNKASMEAAIKAMMEKTDSLGRDAENLTKALRGNTKKQGDWGEMILERMLEESGLRKGEEY